MKFAWFSERRADATSRTVIDHVDDVARVASVASFTLDLDRLCLLDRWSGCPAQSRGRDLRTNREARDRKSDRSRLDVTVTDGSLTLRVRCRARLATEVRSSRLFRDVALDNAGSAGAAVLAPQVNGTERRTILWPRDHSLSSTGSEAIDGDAVGEREARHGALRGQECRWAAARRDPEGFEDLQRCS